MVRRAPFSDNPEVGVRGQRTRQRILDAALEVFGSEGYHGGSIEDIAKVAGCSRVSFYQYFASKEDVFRHLAEQLARQVSASTEPLDPLTAGADGWSAMHAWVERYTEIYARYEPVFHAYENDVTLASIAARTGAEVVTRIHSRLVTTALAPRQLDRVIRLLLECLGHTLGVVATLREFAPAAYPDERVTVAITDVLHRTVFGLRAGVNAHPPVGAPPPALDFGSEMRELLQQGDGAPGRDSAGNQVLTALLTSGHDVFVSEGYHNTRVDDVVEAAGVSHGAFYRYFRNRDDLARILTVRALRTIGTTLLEMPDLLADEGSTGSAALRRWLRRYNATHSGEAAMLRVWVDAVLQDPALRPDFAPPLDWGRRRMSRYLQPRGFGDVDMDAVVMVSLFGVFGARHRGPAEVEAAAHIIERGLLGH